MTVPFAILHPLVDFCSVAVLATGGITFERWLAYNALAFALQLPLGVALDACPRWLRGMFGAGVALTVAGVVLGVAYAGGDGALGTTRPTEWAALAMACVGNALFHLTAGAFVLKKSPGKSGPVGLFISTGALGLMAGQMAAKGGCAWGALPVAAALAVGGVAALLMPFNRNQARFSLRGDCCGRKAPANVAFGGRLVLLGLFALVIWRSWAGLLAGGMTSDAGLAFVLAGAAVTWAGKTAGGYAADALQRLRETRFSGSVRKLPSPRGLVTAFSVAGSAALCFACSPSHAIMWLALLFAAQLATGPVLSLMYDAGGRRAGTVFGLNCFGLFMGSLI